MTEDDELEEPPPPPLELVEPVELVELVLPPPEVEQLLDDDWTGVVDVELELLDDEPPPPPEVELQLLLEEVELNPLLPMLDDDEELGGGGLGLGAKKLQFSP